MVDKEKRRKHGCYAKGHVPWNKGVKGSIPVNSGSFKKGNIPPNLRAIGSERTDRDGYVYIKVAKAKWVLKHRYLWEQYHDQKIPKGHIVIFLDQDRTNFGKDNLMLLTRSELAILNHETPPDGNKDMNLARINVAKLKRAIGKRRKKWINQKK